MYYKVSYDQEFYDLLMYLRGKYPKELFDLEGIGRQTDMHYFAKEFFGTKTTLADASVDANANVDARDVIGYQWEMPKPFFRMNSYFLLWEKARDMYGINEANGMVESQLRGDYYINDFGDIGRPYCFNFSTYDLMLEGLTMIQKIKSVAPKYLYSFKSQLEQFVVYAANSTLGATGLADLFIVMSYYVHRIFETGKDGHFRLDSDGVLIDWADNVWSYVKENIVSFIYTINQPMRGNQSPFTNLSVFDDYFLDQLCQDYVFPDGSKPDKEIIKKLQEIFLDTMNEELERTPVTFPVTTACFSVNDKGDIQDDNFLRFIAEKNLKFGFINIYHGTTSTLSSCCRLRSDTSNEYFNSFGSGSSKIGSLGVCTVNLPRIAFKYVDSDDPWDDFLMAVEDMVVTIAKINNVKREIIRSRINKGFLPLYTLGHMDLTKQYSTVGLTGINEALEILGYDILSVTGQAKVLEMLKYINAQNDAMQEELKAPHNCEQVPAENSSIKLATKDYLLGFNRVKKMSGYRNAITGEDTYDLSQVYPFYSNQFIPLTTNADMLDRIKLQGKFDKHFSGGAICHVNVSERIEDPKKMADLIRHCAKQGVVYWAVNYNLQECEHGHMGVGQELVCHRCGGRIVGNYTRVVGFLTNVSNWHRVRRTQDYPLRQFYGKEE
jgi:anaerobic ribonucleoside-triphosphate reductase